MSKIAYDTVKLARANNRPTGVDYITNLFPDFFELHGDRRFADDPAIVAGLCTLGRMPVTLIAIEKGRNFRERIQHNFGMTNPEGYRKALRLMKQAEKFHRPVICLVDTSGAYCGVGAEERGQSQAIAENLYEMMTLKTPILSIVIGEGGSGGALGLTVADQVWMLENATFSVISPEGCASILWKDARRASDAAESLKLQASDAYDFSVIQKVISEKDLGKPEFYTRLSQMMTETIKALRALSLEELTERRYQRYRDIGRKG